MNNFFSECDKCKFMVEHIYWGESVKFCQVGTLVFECKDLLLLESNAGCEMFEDVEENVLGGDLE